MLPFQHKSWNFQFAARLIRTSISDIEQVKWWMFICQYCTKNGAGGSENAYILCHCLRKPSLKVLAVVVDNQQRRRASKKFDKTHL